MVLLGASQYHARFVCEPAVLVIKNITVSEFIEAGIASILIPFPYAVDNHQYHNGKILEDKKAAFIIQENEIENKLLETLFKIDRKKCFLMALNAQKSKLNSNVPQTIYSYCKEKIS